MQEKASHNSIGYGITGALLLLSCSICFCAALGRGIFGAFTVTIICLAFALKNKSKIFVPSALLITPLFIFAQYDGLLPCMIAVASGGLIYLLLQKTAKNLRTPDCILAGIFIGLALSTTILLTNTYFGIGAHGSTPLEMLRSYRSLGFHPDFRGLLYGTITLFTMITYPFKFRKLNKVIPAEFITVAIPFVLNIALNPNSDYTTTNEYSFAVQKTLLSADLKTGRQVIAIILTGIAIGILLYILDKQNSYSPKVNAVTGITSGIAVLPRSTDAFTKASLISALFVCGIAAVAVPSVLVRLPLPCVGSMLIVSAWQQVPFRLIPTAIKEKSVIGFFATIICAAAFVILPFYTAVAVCVASSFIISKLHPNPLGKELTE